MPRAFRLALAQVIKDRARAVPGARRPAAVSWPASHRRVV
jgi:hypothetical protein